jgi:hypothetical protein
MTTLERELCRELRTLLRLRAELITEMERLTDDRRVAQQSCALITQQSEALTRYLLTCGPEATEAVAAMCQEPDTQRSTL